MRIITISRQFGSGGREIGKRLADVLGWDYYDREIIETLCEQEGLDEEYVKRVIHNHEWNQVPIHFRQSFTNLGANSAWQLSFLKKESDIIRRIAESGQDCIIVGRDADVLLEEYHPFRIYVCADIECRLKRCMEREQGGLTEKEVLKKIKKIDKNRKQTREILTAASEEQALCFELSVNVTDWDIKKLPAHIAAMAEEWFAENQRTENS